MKVRIVCPSCMWRYAGVIRPDCLNCQGEGLLAVNVPCDVDPWVAARAATLDGVKRDAKLAVGLLAPDPAGSVGLPDSSHVDSADGRMRAGRAAGALLRRMEVRPPPGPRKKATRRTKAEVAADKAKHEATMQAIEHTRAERLAELRRLKQEEATRAATLEAFRLRHPEEYAEVYDSERAMAVIGDLPAVGVRSYTSNAVVARKAHE